MRCLDACSMLDQDFGNHFYHVVEFMVIVSSCSIGITQNLTKFNSWHKDLEFIGFYLKSDGIMPNAAMVEAI